MGYMFGTNSRFNVGVEFGADLVPNAKSEKSGENEFVRTDYLVTVKRGIVRPSLSLIIGMPVSDLVMPYFKIGASRHKSSEKYELWSNEILEGNSMANAGKVLERKFSKAGIAPTVAFGLESRLNNKFSMRYEFEYRFNKKFSKSFSTEGLNAWKLVKAESSGATAMRVQQRRTLTLRMMCVYRPLSSGSGIIK